MRPTMHTTSEHVRVMLRDAAARARGHGRWLRGPCPLCGGGKRHDDAFAYDTDTGLVKCHRCGVTDRPGLDREPSIRERDEQDAERRREMALQIVERSSPIVAGGPVDRYLRSRGLRPSGDEWPRDLRQAQCKHPRGRWSPAMIGVVRSASGVVVGAHRTFVTVDGRKVDDEPVRLSLGPCRGGAVRLGPPSGAIIVGEGIETVLAACIRLPDAGVGWAALSASGLASLDVPVTVQVVTIAVDHDVAGEQATRRLLKRLGRLRIRNVRCVRPRRRGHDMADVLVGGDE